MKKINIFLFYLYVLFVFTPRLNNVYIEFGVAVLWCVSALFLCNKFKKGWKLIVLLWIIYAFVLKAIGFSSASIGNYAIILMFYYPLVVFSVYRKILDKEAINNIIKVIGLILILNVLDNIRLLIIYPNANLELNYSNTYAGLNLGNTVFTTTVMLAALIALSKAIANKPKYWIYVIICLVYMLMSSKATALLIFLTTAYIMIILKIGRQLSNRQRVFLLFAGILLIVIGYLFALQLLVSITKNEYIIERVNALIAGDTNSKFLLRIQLAAISFNTFLKHPFWGVGYVKADLTLVSAASTGIGHHSELIDHLARYGLVGAGFYFAIFINYYKEIKKTIIDNFYQNCAICCFFAFLSFAVLNNCFYESTGIVFFIGIMALANGYIE